MLKKSGLIFTLLVLVVAFGESGFAQQPDKKEAGKKEADDCSQFKMRVVFPENETLSKLTIVKPAEGIDYKGKVVNPCAPPEQRLAELPPVNSSPERTPGSAAPSLKRLPNPESREPESEMKFQLPPLKLKLIK
jgi:hypothetical protein